MKRIIALVFIGLSISTINAQDVTDQLLGNWRFESITMISPKTGYIPTFKEKEINMMKLSMANYWFKKDKTIVLDEKYLETTGISKATWELEEEGKTIVITYVFSDESDINKGNSSNTEAFPWSIDEITNDRLVLNLMGMFVVSFEKKKQKVSDDSKQKRE